MVSEFSWNVHTLLMSCIHIVFTEQTVTKQPSLAHRCWSVAAGPPPINRVIRLTTSASRRTSYDVNHCWMKIVPPKMRLFPRSSFTIVSHDIIPIFCNLTPDSVGPKALGMIFTVDKDLHVRSEVVKSTYLSFCLGMDKNKYLAWRVLIMLHNWNATLPIQM